MMKKQKYQVHQLTMKRVKLRLVKLKQVKIQFKMKIKNKYLTGKVTKQKNH